MVTRKMQISVGDVVDGDDSKEDEAFIVYTTKKQLTKLANSERWFMDGTFDIVPSLFYQLWTIHYQYKEVGHPGVFVLSTHKTADMYQRILDAVFTAVLKIKPDFVLIQATSDFESGLIPVLTSLSFRVDVQVNYQLGANEEFDDNDPTVINRYVQFIGCWFHYSSAIRKWVVDNGLKSCYEADTKDGSTNVIRQHLRRFMALAVSPLRHVEATVAHLYETMPNRLIQSGFQTYFTRTWMTLYKPPLWKVYGHKVKTNNLVEGFHNGLNHRATSKNLDFFALTELLADEIRRIDTEQLQQDMGQTVRRRNGNALRKQERLDSLQRELDVELANCNDNNEIVSLIISHLDNIALAMRS